MRRICAPRRGEGKSQNPRLRTTHPHLTIIFQLSSLSKVAAEFLELGLEHHKKTRTLPAYFSTILDALEQTTDSIDPSDPYNTYAAALGGPIFEDSHVEKIRKALRGFVTPGQCLGFLAQMKDALERVSSENSRQQRFQTRKAQNVLASDGNWTPSPRRVHPSEPLILLSCVASSQSYGHHYPSTRLRMSPVRKL
jgi:hypothetical protein